MRIVGWLLTIQHNMSDSPRIEGLEGLEEKLFVMTYHSYSPCYMVQHMLVKLTKPSKKESTTLPD